MHTCIHVRIKLFCLDYDLSEPWVFHECTALQAILSLCSLSYCCSHQQVLRNLVSMHGAACEHTASGKSGKIVLGKTLEWKLETRTGDGKLETEWKQKLYQSLVQCLLHRPMCSVFIKTLVSTCTGFMTRGLPLLLHCALWLLMWLTIVFMWQAMLQCYNLRSVVHMWEGLGTGL